MNAKQEIPKKEPKRVKAEKKPASKKAESKKPVPKKEGTDRRTNVHDASGVHSVRASVC